MASSNVLQNVHVQDILSVRVSLWASSPELTVWGRGQLLQKRICSPLSKFFPLRIDSMFERGVLSNKANRKSKKLFPA